MSATEYCSSAPRKIKALELRQRALELRLDGYTFSEIAIKLNKSQGRAHQLIREAMQYYSDDIAKLAQQEIERQLATTDELLKVHLPLAREGSYESAQMVLKTLERRAKVLGIDHAAKGATIQTNQDESTAYVVVTPQVALDAEEWAKQYVEAHPQAS